MTRQTLIVLSSAFLLLASNAHAVSSTTYKYRVYAPSLKNSGNSPGNNTVPPTEPPQSNGIQVLVEQFSSIGCVLNGGASYTPLNPQAGADYAAQCTYYLGQWAFTYPLRQSGYTVVMTNTAPVGGQVVQITQTNPNGAGCDLRKSTGRFYTTWDNGVDMLPSDFTLCMNNQLIGKYYTMLDIDYPNTYQTVNTVSGAVGLEEKVTTSVPGPGCMISYGYQNLNYRYAVNFIENGVSLCQAGTTVYYRESDHSIHSTP